jgi:hypothetical protein
LATSTVRSLPQPARRVSSAASFTLVSAVGILQAPQSPGRAALLLQTWWRCRASTLRYGIFRYAVLRIQAHLRGHHERVHVGTRYAAAMLLLDWARNHCLPLLRRGSRPAAVAESPTASISANAHEVARLSSAVHAPSPGVCVPTTNASGGSCVHSASPTTDISAVGQSLDGTHLTIKPVQVQGIPQTLALQPLQSMHEDEQPARVSTPPPEAVSGVVSDTWARIS